MFSNPQRFVIISAALGLGCYLLKTGDETGYAAIAAAVFFIYGYFRYNAIRPAFLAVHRGEIETARRLSASIKFPNLLSEQSRAYLHWIYGALAFSDGNFCLADVQMRNAIAGKLRTSNDRCIATATLAQIAAKNGRLDEANRLMNKAKLIPHKEETNEFLQNAIDEIKMA